MNIRGAHTAFPALRAKLPGLVKEQRRLEALIAPGLPHVKPEKEVRKEIDALLVKAGLASGDAVTCLGYDVTHNERKGQTSLNETKLVAALVAGGVDADFAVTAIAASMETGDPSKFAQVEPSKGAKVRT